jgi:hypothetical protein
MKEDDDDDDYDDDDDSYEICLLIIQSPLSKYRMKQVDTE